MRPILLSFGCFGPYRAAQCVDFDALRSRGLFLICGDTGAGKTVLLDAMCCALYGRACSEKRGELPDLRCRAALDDEKTFVRLEMAHQGRVYRITRELRITRGGRPVEQDFCQVFTSGAWESVLPSPTPRKLNQYIQELLGLDYRQFRQIVMLPQGQFEDFLVAKSGDKEEILKIIFHASRWTEAAQEVKRRAEAENARLQQESDALRARLAQYGCDTPEALGESIAKEKDALQALEASLEQAKAARLQAEARFTQADKAADAFSALEKREQALKELDAQEERWAREQALLALAEAAGRLEPEYQSFIRLESEARAAAESMAAAEAAEKSAENAMSRLRARREKHAAEQPRHEARRRLLSAMEAARPAYETLDAKRAACQAAQAAQTAAETEQSRAAARLTQRVNAWMAQSQTRDELAARLLSARAAWDKHAAHRLAAALRPGDRCPVCGQTVAEPPQTPEGQSSRVTEAELDDMNRRLTAAGQAVQAAYEARQAAEKADVAAREARANAQTALAARRAEYESAMKNTLPGIENAGALDAKMAETRAALSAFEAEKEAIAASEALALADWGEKKGRLDAARKAKAQSEQAAQAARARLNQLAAESGFATVAALRAARLGEEERQARLLALHRYEAERQAARREYETQREVLRDVPRPDIMRLQSEKQAAQDAEAQALLNLMETRRQAEAMEALLADVLPQRQRLDEEKARADADLLFAQRLSPRSGVSLSMYVLGAMFGSVLAVANRLLEGVHGGRYQLRRTNERVGSAMQRGLDLMVLDGYNGQLRAAGTLSGGEKFLVSLSLAIGLSTVVQAQSGAMRLEIMLIDEGFGTLDQASIGDALDMLESLREGSGLVGVISHVERLAETIPTRIEVLKSEQGSTLKLRL